MSHNPPNLKVDLAVERNCRAFGIGGLQIHLPTKRRYSLHGKFSVEHCNNDRAKPRLKRSVERASTIAPKAEKMSRM